ncbi:MAG: ribonuclease-3 [Bacteroidia bacterium]|jgi:ribonuclease-3
MRAVIGIGHNFGNGELRQRALTHASTGATRDNERLEFLGDTVLDLIAAEELFRKHPGHSEGRLTAAKAWLVSRETLAEAARHIGLAEQADFGRGMSAETAPRSVLANLYEAVLGAIYLDAGLEAARAWTLETLASAFALASSAGEERNHKQRLQEFAQSGGGEPPHYSLLDQRGEAHRRAFLVQASVDGEPYPSAWGRTRKEAERYAAMEALQVIETEAS